MNKQYLSLAGVFIIGLAAGYGLFNWRTNSTMHASKCVSPEEAALNACQNELAGVKGDPKMGHSMEHQMMGMTDRMKNKTGDELDKIFLTDMIVHHQGAVDMAEALLKETKRPELQKMGKDIIDAQTKEIAQMEGWLTTWFK